MKPFTSLSSPAVPLALANVDTDQLIPARFMKRPRSEGYGGFLLHDLRQGGAGDTSAAVLDEPRFADAACLVARRNFGCGSSREAAVYALADFGFRCIVAPSFGDIFASNAVKNGLVPARVSEEDVDRLLQNESLLAGQPVAIDLAEQVIRAGNAVVAFTIDAGWKARLLNGWDDIDLTRAKRREIDAFRARDLAERPWATPSDNDLA